MCYIFCDIHNESYNVNFRYGFPDLVADIGGYLGFFLGASILSLFDQAVELMLSCWRKMKDGKVLGAKGTKLIPWVWEQTRNT